MQSALIVHSRHTRNFAQKLAKKYRKVTFLEVTHPPREDILKIKNNKDIVIGIGGGSVIDIAKIISGRKRCIAIPTTASGAAMTPFATVWGKEKITIPTKKPILRNIFPLSKVSLPHPVLKSTLYDVLSHAVESFWSKNADRFSRSYSKKAIFLARKYLLKKNKNINGLIKAGNLAGKAIAITKTNVVHATSYPLTAEYGIDHGRACGMLLPYFIEYMDNQQLARLFGLASTKALVALLKRAYKFLPDSDFDINFITEKALRYDRINDGPKKINRSILIAILKKAFA